MLMTLVRSGDKENNNISWYLHHPVCLSFFLSPLPPPPSLFPSANPECGFKKLSPLVKRKVTKQVECAIQVKLIANLNSIKGGGCKWTHPSRLPHSTPWFLLVPVSSFLLANLLALLINGNWLHQSATGQGGQDEWTDRKD